MRRYPTVTEHLHDRTSTKRYLHLKLDACLYLCYYTTHRMAYTSWQTQQARLEVVSVGPTVNIVSMDVRHPSNRRHAARNDIVPYPRINAARYNGSTRHTHEPANPLSRICNYKIRPDVTYNLDLTRTSPSLHHFAGSGSNTDQWSWDVPAYRQSIFNTAEHNAKFSHM